MAVAAVIGLIVATYLTPPPGMESWLVLVGTGAAIAGGAIGILVHQTPSWAKILLVVIVLSGWLFAINGFRAIIAGEPGSEAANMLLFWTAAVFVPIGFLIELGGLKLTDKKT